MNRIFRLEGSHISTVRRNYQKVSAFQNPPSHFPDLVMNGKNVSMNGIKEATEG
jgi:hypothetical protein